MRRDLTTALIAILVMTVVLGLAYPLAMTGISQVAFGEKADGDPSLLAAPRTNGKKPDRAYFQPRPSATGYSATATYFANRGPNQKSAKEFYDEQVAAYLALEGPTSPGLDAAGIPIDAVTASASGVDPHISPANAAIQARRVAAVRHLPAERVEQLIDDATDGRFLGIFGEPAVNVTTLNEALDS